MVKGISSINGLIKAGTLAAMLAGSTALYASNPIKKDAQPNQTEIVSKSGADAIKAANMQGVNQQNTVPRKHNRELDATLRKFIENDEDREYINTVINNVYKTQGTYLGTVFVQHIIDFNQFFAFLTENTDVQINNNINPKLGREIKKFGPQFFRTLEPYAEDILDTADKMHNEKLEEALGFDHIPGLWETYDRVKNIISSSDILTTSEILDFLSTYKKYLDNKEKTTDIEESANILARKIFIYDKMVYNKVLQKFSVFDNRQFKNGDKTMQDYFDMWMDSVKPESKY